MVATCLSFAMVCSFSLTCDSTLAAANLGLKSEDAAVEIGKEDVLLTLEVSSGLAVEVMVGGPKTKRVATVMRWGTRTSETGRRGCRMGRRGSQEIRWAIPLG